MKDLRCFLDILEEKGSKEIVHVEREVEPAYELAALLRKLQDEERYPAVYFHKVKGASVPVVSNLFADLNHNAYALGTTLEGLLDVYMSREEKRIPAKLIKDGPVKEVIKIGKEVDLSQLPHIIHCEKDAGPYMTAGIVVAKDPDSGVRNAGLYRIPMTKDRRRLGLYIGTYSHLGHIYRKFEAANKPMEVAVFIGHYPTTYMGSQSRVPFHVDEYDIMGGLAEEPLEVVKGETIDLEVPAWAEMVIEGKVPPGMREPEAPFGEYTFHYGPQRLSQVIETTAITHRRDPIFLDIFSAHVDHQHPGAPARESWLYKRVKEVWPQLVTVRIPKWGCKHLVIVQIKKEVDGLGKNVGLAALAADPAHKIAIVVDDDVNIYDDKDVWWAVVMRTQHWNFSFIEDTHTIELDPASYSIRSRVEKDSLSTKIIIDATKPVGVPFEERADVAPELWKRIAVRDYIQEV